MGCRFTHTERQWLSISTHISTLVLGLSTLAIPVDCLGDFGPRGLSVQYTQDVRGCPPAHTGRLWLSVSTHMTFVAVCVCPCLSVRTHRTSVAVHQCTYQHAVHTGRPWVSVSTHRTSVGVRQHTQDVRGCPCVSVGTHKTSVAVRVCLCPRGQPVQYRQDVRGCPPAHTRRLWLYVCVCACPSVSISTDRTSVAVHQYTYQHSVQYTQDVRGCPPAHTGRLWLSVRTHRTSVADVRVCPSEHTGRVWLSVCVRLCPSAHTGRPWLSISTHISTLVLELSTLALPVDCLGDFGPCGLSVQYTQDVCGCPPAHTGCLWLSVAVRQHTQDVCGCPCVSVCVCQHTQNVYVCPSAHTGCLWLSMCVHVCPSEHTGHPWLSISTHISTLVLGLSTLTLPVDSLGYFGPRGLSVQYTQDVRGCLPAHTGHLWLSVSTHRTYVAVCGCPCVSVSTHRTSVAVHQLSVQYTYQHVCPWTQHAGPSRGLFGTSVAVCHHTQDVRGCPCVSVGVRQHTQDGHGCQWLSASTHRMSGCVRHHTQNVHVCSCVSVCVCQPTQDVRGCLSVHISACWSLYSARWPIPWTVWVILAHVGCLFSTHRTSVGVRQHTQDVCGYPWLSVSTHKTSMAVRVCPCVSFSTHMTYVAVHQYTYQHAGPCTQHAGPCTQHAGPSRGMFGTHMTSVAVCMCLCVSVSTHTMSVAVHQYTYQDYTQDVRGCPPAYTGRLWLSVSTHMTSVAVCVCPCVFARTHRTSVAVHQCTYQHAGPWTQHAGPSRGLFGTSVGVRQHTQNVRGCPSAHTRRPWLSVCVRVCPSAHTGRLWLSISTHISTLVLGLSTLALPVDCSGDFRQRGLSVQYTQDVRGCPSVQIGHPCVSVSTHRMSVAVRVCPCVSVSTHMTSVAVHQCTYQHVGPWTQHASPSCGLFG
ncbi:hypothetical protein YC2023_066318 [Brassica napus]